MTNPPSEVYEGKRRKWLNKLNSASLPTRTADTLFPPIHAHLD